MSTASYSLIRSSIGRKVFMALTGLFLCTFLVGHLAGNLQLFIPGEEGRVAFNTYAYFMTHNPVVKILSYLTYFSIIFHAIDGLVLTIRNRKARPVKYYKSKSNANSAWSSRNMGILGTIILVFIVVHMQNFWFVMHFGEIGTQAVDGYKEPIKDLHTVVMAFFNAETNTYAPLVTGLYVIAMFALAFHLAHGFQSGFQSLGINHSMYTPVIKAVGMGFAIIVPAAFASIPIYLYISGLIG